MVRVANGQWLAAMARRRGTWTVIHGWSVPHGLSIASNAKRYHPRVRLAREGESRLYSLTAQQIEELHRVGNSFMVLWRDLPATG
ncbi:MAG: hypothetical protein R3B97_06300 [Dehalococcoidia bacterium]|nr:hypothetical protein [Dehalococcoidia bacterium]MCB9486390.1 hypothetical protein [Thermoflexaceae bacterium]